MATLSGSFEKSAAKELKLWDCDAMYPAPVRTKVNAMELVTGTIKKGFEIFNQVKGMLPEGAMKNMKIPGLPAGMQA